MHSLGMKHQPKCMKGLMNAITLAASIQEFVRHHVELIIAMER